MIMLGIVLNNLSLFEEEESAESKWPTVVFVK